MSGKLPISVFIITKNEEERLPYALNSVKDWVDEVIIIDSGSDDRTLEIAKEHGAVALHNDWQGYGQQKIFGESQCKNKWILNIDADEEVSIGLKEEICALFSSGKELECDAYQIKWEMIFLGQDKPPKFATGGEVIRLYNLDKAGFRESTIHDSVIAKSGVDLKVGKLHGIFYHRCFKSLKHWVDKVNFYTSEQAEEWISKGRKQPSIFRILTEPFTAFLKSYFIRKYVFYGVDGFNASIIYAFSKVLRLAKIREIYRINKLK